MTSPVDTSVKHFSSTMVGAPVLTRAAGSLIALLDATLVNGWAALTLTSLTVANGIATAAYSGTFPATPESVVLISGVTGALAGLNGEQKVTAIGTGTVSWATASASGTAAGTIGMKMAPAGWAKVFTGTNLAVYQSTDPQGNRFFLRINDTAVKDARAVGYESMTAISTGTNLFPTSAQLSGGMYWSKSLSEDASASTWTIIANAKRFYFMPAPGSGTFGSGYYDAKAIYAFGEFPSLKSTPDGYATFIAGGTAAISPYTMLSQLGADFNAGGLYIARLHTNAVGARAASWQPPAGNVSGYNSGIAQGTNGPVLASVGARLMLVQNLIDIDRPTYGPRGQLPELALCPQGINLSLNLLDGDLVPGVGALAGRKLRAVSAHYQPANYGSSDGTYRAMVFFDGTGPWS